MTGKLYIDGSDAYLYFGVYLEDNGLRQLIQYSSFQKIESTDWPDEDGEEYDLTAPTLDTRTLQLPFNITDVHDAENLFDVLSQGAYHLFHVPALGKTWKLRMTSNGSFSSLVTLGKLTLSFADDFPVVPNAECLDFGKSGVLQVGYELDGVDMSQYGAYILKGSHNDLRKAPQVKTNLTVKTKGMAGVKYDNEKVFFKPKDVTLNVLIKTPTAEAFWRRYDALFCALLKPGLHTFYFRDTNEEYDCFYSKQSVQQLNILPNGGIWCQFALTLTFASNRPMSNYMLLASEEGDWIITEDSDASQLIIKPLSGISYMILESGQYVVTEDGNNLIYSLN